MKPSMWTRVLDALTHGDKNDKLFQAYERSKSELEGCRKLPQARDHVDELRRNEVAYSGDEYYDVESDGADASYIDSTINREEMIYALGIGLIWFALWALLR